MYRFVALTANRALARLSEGIRPCKFSLGFISGRRRAGSGGTWACLPREVSIVADQKDNDLKKRSPMRHKNSGNESKDEGAQAIRLSEKAIFPLLVAASYGQFSHACALLRSRWSGLGFHSFRRGFDSCVYAALSFHTHMLCGYCASHA